MDETSFETLFRENFEVLNNIAYTVVKDKDVSKDIVQQVFYKLWKNRSSVDIRTSMRSYLHRAVINTSLNHLEKNKRLVKVEDDQLAKSTIATGVDAIGQLSYNELQGKLKVAVDALPPRCRLVFSLSRFEGLSNQEIADRMETSIKTVENQMGKALKSLREQLRPLLEHSMISILLGVNCINLKFAWVYVAPYLS